MKQPSQESLTSLLLPAALILGFVLLLSLNIDTAPREASNAPLEAWLKVAAGFLAGIAEISAAGVIGVAIVRGILMYLRQLLSGARHAIDVTERIRLQLGRGLALGLEFSVASDILRTSVAPTRSDLLNLGAIILLRTLLNIFLEREIRQVEQSRLPESEPRYREL